MVSFYPGPSRIHDEIPAYVKEAARLGVMSMNHRSEGFEEMMKKTISLLQQKLNIPKNYTILFTSSATECWEIIAQSLITEKSYHFFNGAFGKKWFDYTHALNQSAEAIVFNREEKLDLATFSSSFKNTVCCFTQNETSNGTQVDNSVLKAFRKKHPDQLIAVDATSSMAGIQVNFKLGDVWFASVQKCFGLPAGLALMVCSPKAIERVNTVNERQHYNSLASMVIMANRFQTTHTPNVLGIYLLMRVLEKSKTLREVHDTTLYRFDSWEKFLTEFKNIKLLIENKSVRSLTVLPVVGESKTIERIKSKTKKAGFLLGEGYGELKDNTFRIANFPAIKEKEIKALKKFLRALEKE
jgi:phosphoserine aminotransferase